MSWLVLKKMPDGYRMTMAENEFEATVICSNLWAAWIPGLKKSSVVEELEPGQNVWLLRKKRIEEIECQK